MEACDAVGGLCETFSFDASLHKCVHCAKYDKSLESCTLRDIVCWAGGDSALTCAYLPLVHAKCMEPHHQTIHGAILSSGYICKATNNEGKLQMKCYIVAPSTKAKDIVASMERNITTVWKNACLKVIELFDNEGRELMHQLKNDAVLFKDFPLHLVISG